MHLKHVVSICLILLLFLFSPLSIFGQDSTPRSNSSVASDESEVYLAFRHRSAINTLIIAYYKDDQFYLPVTELFNTLQIDVKPRLNGNIVLTGVFLDTGERYTINFTRKFAEFRDQRIQLENSDFLLKEIDYFLRPEIFERLFKLNFTVDFNALSLNLEAPYTLPVVARYIRAQERERAQTNLYQFEDYDLQFDRNRQLFNGGFLDYTLSANITETNNIFSAATDIGLEIGGGDLQGSMLGVFSQNYDAFTTNNLRWRYVDQKSQWFRQLYVGQVNSVGLTDQQILGVRITNNPVRPRILFDEFVINGNTIPQSEVELYLNNALIDFQESDELGNYRFLVPMTYGSSRLNLRVFGPTGQVEEISDRIQIPFTFLPPGETTYNINAGQLEDPFFSSSNNLFVLQSDIGTGFTDWLTGKAGVEYFEGVHQDLPSIYGSLSARISSNYLFNLDIAPETYYKLSTSVVYPSSASWGVDFTHYNTSNRIYNFTNSNQELSGNFFIPFDIGNIPFYMRMDGSRQFRDFADLTRYRFNINSRIERLNVSLGFQDNQVGNPKFEISSSARYTGSLTYTISHTSGVPRYLRGSFIRAQTNYSPALSQVEDLEFILSQNIFRQGRLQLSFRRNFIGGFNSIGFNFTLDLDKLRSTSTFRRVRESNSFTNTIRGSIGYDSEHGNLLATSRQQVGRSGAAIRLYVDSNNSGSLDQGDDLIPNNAVRLRRSSGSIEDQSGVTYLTQLQAYDRYNLEINKGVIQNPLLVPDLDQFSFVTDPNSYKPIDVPFYMSGVVSGSVRQVVEDTSRAVAGLKVILEDLENQEVTELRTFSDGSFYSYEVPPGNYRIYVDSTQMELLDVRSQPRFHEFRVAALAEGDFIEGLDLKLIPGSIDTAKTEDSLLVDTSPDKEPAGTSKFQIQIGSFKFYSNATWAAVTAQQQFKQPFNIKYNTLRNLYAVRTQPIDQLQTAINQLLTIQESKFDMPALVVLEDTTQQVAGPTDYTFSVQLAAYAHESQAKKTIARLQQSLNTDFTYQYDSKRNLYKVSTVPFKTLDNAREKLTEINNQSFNDAFILIKADVVSKEMDFDYNIRIDGVAPESEHEYLNQIKGTEEYSKLAINREAENGIIILEHIPDWSMVVDLKQKLSHISGMGQPIIMLIEKD